MCVPLSFWCLFRMLWIYRCNHNNVMLSLLTQRKVVRSVDLNYPIGNNTEMINDSQFEISSFRLCQQLCLLVDCLLILISSLIHLKQLKEIQKLNPRVTYTRKHTYSHTIQPNFECIQTKEHQTNDLPKRMNASYCLYSCHLSNGKFISVYPVRIIERL